MLSVFKIGDRVFYGWVVVGAIVATGFIMMGINSTFGVFFKSLEETFDLTRATTSSVLSVRMVFSGAAAILGGWAIDRYGPRKVVSVMGFFVGLSLILTGLTTASWQLFITYGLLMSIGTGAVFVVMTSTVLRWFDRKRGLALGIAGTGGGFGTAIFAPLSASLINSLEWRTTIMLLGGVAWLVMLPVAQLIKKDPGEIGALPDGEAPGYQPAGAEREAGHLPKPPLSRVFRNQNFWAFLFIWLTMAFSSFFIMTHIVPHAIDIGFSSVQSATILSVGGIAMLIGRLSAGIISDRVSVKWVAIVSSLIQFAAILGLVWGRELWMLYLFGLVNGLTFGGFGTSISMLIGSSFSLDNIGKILGILEIGIFIGGAVGPYLGGLIFDNTGSYDTAFLIMGGTVLIRVLLLTVLRTDSAGQDR
ncbi:MAG: MFS transporter [Dehalococcoidales bacterium]